MTYVLCFFHPTASATAYGQKPKFILAKHLGTTEGENSALWSNTEIHILYSKLSNFSYLLASWLCGLGLHSDDQKNTASNPVL